MRFDWFDYFDDGGDTKRDAADWLFAACAVALIAATCWLAAGCKTERADADDTVVKLARAVALVAVIDADEETRQIALPDSLDNADSTGLAPDALSSVWHDAAAPVESAFRKLPIHVYSIVANCEVCERAKRELKAAGFPLSPAKTPRWVTTSPTICWRVGNRWNYVFGYAGFEAWLPIYLKSLEPASHEAGQSPTPLSEVRRMLALLRPLPHETFIDYGCGDGRWLIEAARTYGCRAVGVEIEPAQVAKARRAISEAGLSDKAQVIEGDVLAVNVDAQVGVAYLYPDTLTQLQPKLMALDRFATYMHPVDGVTMQQNGDAWVWQRPEPVRQQWAWYDGQAYSGRVCSDPRCRMCAEIARQLWGGN